MGVIIKLSFVFRKEILYEVNFDVMASYFTGKKYFNEKNCNEKYSPAQI